MLERVARLGNFVGDEFHFESVEEGVFANMVCPFTLETPPVSGRILYLDGRGQLWQFDARAL